MTVENVAAGNNLNHINEIQEPVKKGKTTSGKAVENLTRAAHGIAAVVCAIAAVLSLAISVPAYAILRAVDHFKGVQFEGLKPKSDKALCAYPVQLTAFFVVHAVKQAHDVNKGTVSV